MLERAELEQRLRKLKQQLYPQAVPDKKEREYVEATAAELQEKFRKAVQGIKEIEDVNICGSVGKNTWVKGKREVDIFLLFKKGTAKHVMEKFTEEVAKQVLESCQPIKASRQYIRGKYKDFEVDVVPVYKIERPEEFVCITDVTPFHVQYVRSRLAAEQRDEVRILKKYLQLVHCYGAESYISGLSGYAAELLIIYYGGFERCLASLCTSKPPIYIDIEQRYGSLAAARAVLSAPKLRSPIIIIDPVLPTRNAAASLSYQRFARLLYATFQTVDALPQEKPVLKKYKLTFYLPENVFGKKVLAQATAFFSRLKRRLQQEGFFVLEYEVHSPSSGIYCIEFKLLNSELPELGIKLGPYIWLVSAVKQFVHEHADALTFGLEDTRIYAVYKRRLRNIKEFVEHLLKESELARATFLQQVKRWEIEEC
ncbi:MAG: hypothetical protein GXO42_01915 [bacterium]|nr:hypothetical protein [bacterium]